jgi:flagellar basal body rod protein FlgC
MSASKAIEAARSGLVAAETRLEATAHNVANMQTERYRPLRATSIEAPANGVRVTISREAREGADMVRDAVERIAAVAAYQANLAMLRSAEKSLEAVPALGATEETRR